jgi:hypothetical protein
VVNCIAKMMAGKKIMENHRRGGGATRFIDRLGSRKGFAYTRPSASQNQPLGSVQLFSSLKPARWSSRVMERRLNL